MEHSKKQTEAKKRYDREYRRTKMLSIAFRLSKEHDKEYIEIYKSIPDKTKFLKDSLRIWKEMNTKA